MLFCWHGGCCKKQSIAKFQQRCLPLDRTTKANGTITINGILVPVSWDSSGQVVCVAVSTFDEKEYRIADHDAPSRWQDYLNREVTVRGRPYQLGIEQWITVQSFHIIESVPHAELNKK
jgi:hypothetical protein